MSPFPLQHAARAPEPRPQDADIGFARAISGDWQGHGFSLAVRPAPAADGPCFLDMHLTTESLFVAAVGPGSDAGRGIEPSTLAYDQDVVDLVSGARLDHDAGMWFAHPVSASERRSGQAITLFSTGADGELTIASGNACTTHDPLDAIAPVNTAPFAVGDPVPKAGTRGAFAPYDLGDVPQKASRCRTPVGAAWAWSFTSLSPQAVLDDPTSLLRATVERQAVERLTTAHVASNAALDLLAPAAQTTPLCDPTFSATFWVERVREGGRTFDQLQYVRATAAHFAPSAASPVFIWPQVRVATLRRVGQPRHQGFH